MAATHKPHTAPCACVNTHVQDNILQLAHQKRIMLIIELQKAPLCSFGIRTFSGVRGQMLLALVISHQQGLEDHR